MIKIVRKYRELSFENRTILITVIGLCFSAVSAIAKFIIGLLSDYNLCTIAVYTFALLMAKLQCVLGVKTSKRSLKTRNTLVSVWMFLSSAVYTGFMIRTLFVAREIKEQSLVYVLLLAFVSFCELGLAIAGIIRTKNSGLLYRNIKIINFCVALIAILTTQFSILNMSSKSSNANVVNAYSGMGVGIFISLCAVFILFAPKLGVVDREHNVFIPHENSENGIAETNDGAMEITLCRSRVYGSYIYKATVANGTVDGYIVRGRSLWKRMNIPLKILCCVLSEILLPVWLIGRLVFMLRSANLPGRLEKKMKNLGYVKADTAENGEDES